MRGMIVGMSLLVGVAACGSNDAPSEMADAGTLDAVIVADAAPDGMPDAAPDAVPDALPDADAAPDGGPAAVIDSVSIVGQADREVTQGGAGVVIVRGSRLGDVTAARLQSTAGVDDVDMPILSQRGDELSLALEVPHGHGLGPLALVITTGTGAVRHEDALTVTPIVLAPTGDYLGRGTYASPRLLHGLFNDVDTLASGDVVHLTAGRHVCGAAITIPRGVIVRGEGRDRTTIVGTEDTPFGGFTTGVGSGSTELRDLAIVSGRDMALRVAEGPLVVEDVAIETATGSGLYLSSRSTAVLRDLRFTGGFDSVGITVGSPGVGAPTVIAQRVQIEGGHACVAVGAGVMTITDSRLSGCEYGITVARSPHLQVTDTSIAANTAGIQAEHSDLTVERVVITGPGAPWSSGVRTHGGRLRVVSTSIADVSSAMYLGDFETTDVSLDDVRIAASEYGVYVKSNDTSSRFVARRLRVSTRATALRLWGGIAVDLGTPASPGDNTLVSSEDIALRDQRFPETVLDARGTTLNGTAHTGEVVGPVVRGRDYELWQGVRARF